VFGVLGLKFAGGCSWRALLSVDRCDTCMNALRATEAKRFINHF